MVRNAPCFVGQQRHRIGLHRRTDAKRRQDSENGKEHTQPLHVQTALKGVHRTAVCVTVRRLHTILHRQQALRIFRRDAEDTCQPAPQHCTRAAQRHSCCHTHDVACSDGCRQCRCQRAKLTHVALRTGVLLHRKPYSRQQFTLRYTQSERQKHVRSQQ